MGTSVSVTSGGGDISIDALFGDTLSVRSVGGAIRMKGARAAVEGEFTVGKLARGCCPMSTCASTTTLVSPAARCGKNNGGVDDTAMFARRWLSSDAAAASARPTTLLPPPRGLFLLERNPYLPWDAQEAAFASRRFTGVVHPDLPIWDEPPSPRPTGVIPPRVARLSKTELNVMPGYHVQTIVASRCSGKEEVRWRCNNASEVGARALLMVSGEDAAQSSTSEGSAGRGGSSFGGVGLGGMFGRRSRLNSLSLLRVAREMQARGEMDDDVELACSHNPIADQGIDRLSQKLGEGATLVVTQPALLANKHAEWWQAFTGAGLHDDARVVVGVAVPHSSKNLEFWLRLAGADLDQSAEAADLLAEWRRAEADLPTDVFRDWCEERLELAVLAALSDDRVSGVHVMPVTTHGRAPQPALIGRHGLTTIP